MDIAKKITSYIKGEIFYFYSDSFKQNYSNTKEGLNLLYSREEIDLGSLLSSSPQKRSSVLLFSDNFIFNILKFEKLPSKKNEVDEMLTWRLSKIFPEDLSKFNHNYYKMDKNTFFSILITKEKLKEIHEIYKENNMALTFVGSTLVEALNISKENLIVEVCGTQAFIVLKNSTAPVFIRKIIFSSPEALFREIKKIISYGKKKVNVEVLGIDFFNYDNKFKEISIRTACNKILSIERLKFYSAKNILEAIV